MSSRNTHSFSQFWSDVLKSLPLGHTRGVGQAAFLLEDLGRPPHLAFPTSRAFLHFMVQGHSLQHQSQKWLVLKDKLKHIKKFKSLFEKKINSNWAVPNGKWLGELHQQQLRQDFCKEDVEAKQGNYLVD